MAARRMVSHQCPKRLVRSRMEIRKVIASNQGVPSSHLPRSRRRDVIGIMKSLATEIILGEDMGIGEAANGMISNQIGKIVITEGIIVLMADGISHSITAVRVEMEEITTSHPTVARMIMDEILARGEIPEIQGHDHLPKTRYLEKEMITVAEVMLVVAGDEEDGFLQGVGDHPLGEGVVVDVAVAGEAGVRRL